MRGAVVCMPLCVHVRLCGVCGGRVCVCGRVCVDGCVDERVKGRVEGRFEVCMWKRVCGRMCGRVCGWAITTFEIEDLCEE